MTIANESLLRGFNFSSLRFIWQQMTEIGRQKTRAELFKTTKSTLYPRLTVSLNLMITLSPSTIRFKTTLLTNVSTYEME
jgi:hypothetical protein